MKAEYKDKEIYKAHWFEQLKEIKDSDWLKSKQTERDKKENKLGNKISETYCIDILKLLARKGYYVYSKDKEGEPHFCPSEKLMMKIMSEILSLHKVDGYLDDKEWELMQTGFAILQSTFGRCFPDIIFPSEWFGDYDKKEWLTIQTVVLSHLLALIFGGGDETKGDSQIIKDFYQNKFDKDIKVLLDWQINIKQNPKTRAFAIVAKEIDKSSSYVRDNYTGT